MSATQDDRPDGKRGMSVARADRAYQRRGIGITRAPPSRSTRIDPDMEAYRGGIHFLYTRIRKVGAVPR